MFMKYVNCVDVLIRFSVLCPKAHKGQYAEYLNVLGFLKNLIYCVSKKVATLENDWKYSVVSFPRPQRDNFITFLLYHTDREKQ